MGSYSLRAGFAAPLLLLLAAMPAPPQEGFESRVRAFEKETADLLLAEAKTFTAAGDVEAAQVCAEIAAWLRPEDSTLTEASTALKACVRLLDKSAKRRPDLLRDAAARISDRKHEGPLARIPAATRPLRRDSDSLRVTLQGEKLILTGASYVSESDPEGSADLDPPRRLLVSDDEVLFLDRGRFESHPKADSSLRAEGDLPSLRAARLASVASREGSPIASRLLVASEMLRSVRSVVRCLERLNDHRLAAGLPPVHFSAERSVGCFLHSRYLAMESAERTLGMKAHDEDALSPYRTQEGEVAGRRGVLCSQSADYSIDGYIATLYHRTPLLHPKLERVGIGEWFHNWQVRSLVDPGPLPREDRVVRFPPPDGRGVFTRFATEEIPNPLPDKAPPAGYPITLAFYGDDVPSMVSGVLTESESGREIACYASSPQVPANAVRPDNSASVCLIPKEPLRAGVSYEVRISGLMERKDRVWRWSFQTRERPLSW